jgi:hypothetical protein
MAALCTSCTVLPSLTLLAALDFRFSPGGLLVGAILRGVRKAAVHARPHAETYTQRLFPGVGPPSSDGPR